MDVQLTSLSKGAGCGCKIGPSVLEHILSTSVPEYQTENLLVGTHTRDDAAVYDLGDGTAVISTMDFFTPIVDDAFDFGRIAATNAISDVYAMGGTPQMAIAILGWPIDAQPLEPVRRIMDGARTVCYEARIPLAGGHSIDNPAPIFGLSVTGRVALASLKTNAAAHVGDVLFLTKALGVGLITTAHKKGKASAEHLADAVRSMTTLNSAGEAFGRLEYVHALTDITGFGFLGHLSELCKGAQVGARVTYDHLPMLHKTDLHTYIDEGCIPGATMRNWQSVERMVTPLDLYRKAILCDPQTSGGLLVSVAREHAAAFIHEASAVGLTGLYPIGEITSGTSIEIL